MYPSTEMLISVQNYTLQYRKISPVLSTQITAPVQKHYQSLSKKKNNNNNKLQNKHIHRLCDYILQYNKIHVHIQQYNNMYPSTET